MLALDLYLVSIPKNLLSSSKYFRSSFKVSHLIINQATPWRGFNTNCYMQVKDRLQIFVSNSYRKFVALYDVDTIFYKPHTN